MHRHAASTVSALIGLLLLATTCSCSAMHLDDSVWFQSLAQRVQQTHGAAKLREKLILEAEQQVSPMLPDDSQVGPPPPTEMCATCRKVTSTVFNALADSPTSNSSEEEFHLIELAVNVLCAELTPNLKDSELCMDLADAALKGISEGDREALITLKYNLSMDFCSDLLHVCTVPCCQTVNAPEQIHIGFPTRGDVVAAQQMQATWASYNKAAAPLLQYWEGAQVVNVTATVTTYTVSGWRGWLYGGVMTSLAPDTTYQYRVGDGNQDPSDLMFWSPVMNFTTFPSDIGTKARPLRVASFADMGTGGTHRETINALETLVAQGQIDLIVHGGDISYADGDSYRWDRFMRQMQPVVSRVPYMCIPGNHELFYNFTAYRTRFFMQPPPGHGAPQDAMFYDFSVGPNLRFMMMNSESPINTPLIRTSQFDWAEKVLSEASSARQFIFAAFHRPLYCTSSSPACFAEQDYLQLVLEGMLVKNNVAMVHTGHVHNYERSYPVAHQVRQSTSYENASFPISFVNGAPGCEEGLQAFGDYHGKPRPDWSAKRITQTTFMLSSIHSEQGQGQEIRHHAHIVAHASKNMSILDEIILTKNL